MICRTNHVPTTDRLQEIVQSRERDFPYTAMEADISRFSGRCSPWHWHAHFEFAVIVSGSMELQTRSFHRTLHAGEAYFVNANVLHLCRAAEDAPSVRLRVQLFDRSLLAGAGFIARRFIVPVENTATLEACVFSPADPAQQRLISALENAFSAAEQEESCCELDVVQHLTAAWSALYRLISPRLKEDGEDTREEIRRAKAMLSFIHENYGNSIAVSEIAAAVGVSERECFRCFARVLDTTPKIYLAQYRIDTSMRLLAETDLSITEIAYRCGFSDSSYFGKVFRQLVGCTPRAFRQK